MANKRDLKKRIRQICGEAAVEVLVNLPEDIANDIVLEIAALQSKSLSAVSFSFDRTPRDFDDCRMYKKERRHYNKLAYKKLSADFNHSLTQIVKEINTRLKK